MKSKGDSRYERAMKHKVREFSKYFKNTLNKETCLIDGEEVLAVFQDHSQSNNKDLSDDKYVILPNETVADVGSYMIWRQSEWLVFTEEFKTIPTHQQMKIKEVNENIKWIDSNGEIVNNGDGWGAYVQNQTLYTLGVSFTGNNISVVNAKMMMYMQDNEETKTLKLQDRIFIGDNVYTVMFTDNVSRRGLINYLLEQDTISDVYDNKELRIADYYRKKKEDEEVIGGGNGKVVEILGEEKLKVGRTYTFTASQKEVVREWSIETIDGKELPFIVQERDTTSITLRVKDDNRTIGINANILAKLSDKKIVSKNVKVVSKF